MRILMVLMIMAILPLGAMAEVSPKDGRYRIQSSEGMTLRIDTWTGKCSKLIKVEMGDADKTSMPMWMDIIETLEQLQRIESNLKQSNH